MSENLTKKSPNKVLSLIISPVLIGLASTSTTNSLVEVKLFVAPITTGVVGGAAITTKVKF